MRGINRYAIGTLVLAALLAVGCEDSPMTPTGDVSPQFAPGGNGGGRGGGPGGDDGPPATVEIRNLATDAIRSDGEGIYVGGEETTNVAITDSDFHFSVGAGIKGKQILPNRDLILELGPASEGSDPYGGPNYLESMDFRVHNGLVFVPCDSTVQTHGRLAYGSEDGWTHLSFAVPNQNFEGDPLDISRTDNEDGTSTWVITSTGEGYLEIADVHVGTFLVPFEMTVIGEPGCA